MRDAKKPLWRCPECGHRFVTKNLWHSCGRHRIKDHFDAKPPALYKTFQCFVSAAQKWGPVTVYAQKTRIVLQARVRFAAVMVRKNWIHMHMWHKERIQHPLLTKVDSFGGLGFVHHFRLCQPSDVDEAMIDLLRNAYR